MNWNRLVGTASAAIAMAACVGAQAAADAVTVSIGTERPSLARSDDVAVNVTFANTAATPQAVLKWHTPFGEIEEPLFEVRRDGVEVAYLGARYKRPAPGPADYYLLMPGAAYSARVDLSALYDMSVSGNYTIGYATASLNLFGAGPGARVVGAIASAPLTVYIEGRSPRGAPTLDALRAAEDAGAGVAFNKCTAPQQGQVASALAAGAAMARDGADYLATRKTPGQRYGAWFGAGEPSRVAAIRAHFGALQDAFATRPVTVDCGCKKPYYAYVYPTRPYVIFVCNAFWPAPLTGTDSKGGTLVHEMSHFNVVAATDDWVYGQAGAAELALTDPARAVDNADSHEYFGENTPALP